jgi:hypothetical protein
LLNLFSSAISNPACLKPRSSPPHPENNEMRRGLLFGLAEAAVMVLFFALASLVMVMALASEEDVAGKKSYGSDGIDGGMGFSAEP